jgi:hypothetical protein
MPGEAAQILSAANFVRDNVVWSNVETVKGHYNFSRTDSLMAEYDAAGGRASMRWMATLAYSNPLYDSPGPPTSAEDVAAFVAFTVGDPLRRVRRVVGALVRAQWCLLGRRRGQRHAVRRARHGGRQGRRRRWLPRGDVHRPQHGDVVAVRRRPALSRGLPQGGRAQVLERHQPAPVPRLGAGDRARHVPQGPRAAAQALVAGPCRR